MSQEHSPATLGAQPLTRQQIEDWRVVFDRQYADLSKLTSNALEFSIARVHLHQLCDMALSALSETPRSEPTAWAIFASDTHEMIDLSLIDPDEAPGQYVEPLFARSAIREITPEEIRHLIDFHDNASAGAEAQDHFDAAHYHANQGAYFRAMLDVIEKRSVDTLAKMVAK